MSRTSLNDKGTVVVVPLSSQLKKAGGHRTKIPVEHMIKDSTCTDPIVHSVALADQVRVVDASQILGKIGRLSGTALVAVVDNGLAFVFDIR